MLVTLVAYRDAAQIGAFIERASPDVSDAVGDRDADQAAAGQANASFPM